MAADSDNRPQQPYKVNVFGARLDSNIAGFGNEDLGTAGDEQHELSFKLAVRLMQAGKYEEASKEFTRAIGLVDGGLMSREGGQYSIWLAQALHAAGKKDKAEQLLKQCEVHPDGDVRKIADNVLYIMQAPQLKISEDSFVKIQPMEEMEDLRRKRGPLQKKEKPPEKYSIEWYVAEAQKKSKNAPVASDTSPVLPLGITAALFIGTVALLLNNQ